MEPFELHNAEYRLMQIIWEHEPVNSTELVRLCNERLGWKKSTTYTMLRKLADRGILQNRDATVTALVKREQVRQQEGTALLEKEFDGSLPLLFATFLHDRKLSKEEAEEIRRMIEEASE